MPTQEKNFGDVLGQTLQSAGDDLMPFLLTQFNLKRQANVDQFNRRIDLDEHRLRVESAGRSQRASDFNFDRSVIEAGREDEAFAFNLPGQRAKAEAGRKGALVEDTEAQFLLDNPDLFESSLRTKHTPKRSKSAVSPLSFGEKVQTSVRSKDARNATFNRGLVADENKRRESVALKELSRLNTDPSLSEDQRVEAIAKLPLDVDQKFIKGTASDFDLDFRSQDTLRTIQTELDRARKGDPSFNFDQADAGLREFGFGSFLDRQAQQATSPSGTTQQTPSVSSRYTGQEDSFKVTKAQHDRFEKANDEQSITALLDEIVSEIEPGYQRTRTGDEIEQLYMIAFKMLQDEEGRRTRETPESRRKKFSEAR